MPGTVPGAGDKKTKDKPLHSKSLQLSGKDRNIGKLFFFLKQAILIGNVEPPKDIWNL